MKKLVSVGIACGFLLISPNISLGDFGDNPVKSLKKDRWDENRFNLIDPKTNRPTEGYIKKDRWDENRWNIYDDKNKKKGHIKRDRWDDDRWNLFDKQK